jgi:hypothetical protein
MTSTTCLRKQFYHYNPGPGSANPEEPRFQLSSMPYLFNASLVKTAFNLARLVQLAKSQLLVAKCVLTEGEAFGQIFKLVLCFALEIRAVLVD